MRRAFAPGSVAPRSSHGPFSDLTRLAAAVCGTPLAFLQLTDREQAHLESQFGVDTQGDESLALPPHVDTELVVPDARSDPRLASLPLVTGPPWVRAIAGTRIRGVDGSTIGRLLAADTAVRDFTSEQLSLLGDVARQLSLRLAQDQELAAVEDLRRLMDGDLTQARTALAVAERTLHSELKASELFQRTVLAASPDVIYVMEVASWQPVWASGNLLHLLGYADGEPAGPRVKTVPSRGNRRLMTKLVHPEDRERMRSVNEASRVLPDGQATQLRFRCRTKAGDYRWFTRRLTPFARDASGELVQVLAIARDITDTVAAEERLANAALHDPLTGLPNRVLLADRLTNALHRAERSGSQVAVLFIGLDGFKHVNEISGHSAGDTVLRANAARLTGELRPQDTIARVGGDEFVIVLEPAGRTVPNGLEAPADIPDPRVDALTVAARIKRALLPPIEFGEHEHVVTASIGISFASRGDGADEALRDADSAMYRAKALGKDRCEIFDNHLRVEAVERGRIEQLLRAALAAKLDPTRAADDPYRCPSPVLWVAYQPIMELDTGRMCGVEALARLTDAQRHPVSPDDFIPIAEETGLIGPLGRYVLEKACGDLAGWQQGTSLGVSVNLSARQAGIPGLVEQVEKALQLTGVAPAQLTLELTETALLEAGQSTMSALHDLRALGVQISIDDFGTGYASLRYLTQLPVTAVKVDKSFTMGLPNDPTSKAIVQSVAGLARALSLNCVVEGIETLEQLRALPHGVFGQGFLLGRPATAKETGRLLEDRKKCPRQESNLRPST